MGGRLVEVYSSIWTKCMLSDMKELNVKRVNEVVCYGVNDVARSGGTVCGPAISLSICSSALA